jgi:hypothetical protein
MTAAAQDEMSAAESPHQVEDQREHNAQQDRSDQRKIEDGVLATNYDIAWQPAGGQVRASRQYHQNPQQHDDRTNRHQNFACAKHYVNFSPSVRWLKGMATLHRNDAQPVQRFELAAVAAGIGYRAR